MPLDILTVLDPFAPFVWSSDADAPQPDLRTALALWLVSLPDVGTATDQDIRYAAIPEDLDADPALTFAVLAETDDYDLDGPCGTVTARVRFTGSGPDPERAAAAMLALRAAVRLQPRELCEGFRLFGTLTPVAPEGNAGDGVPVQANEGSDARIYSLDAQYALTYRTARPT
jgi:hypothetical protein